jgi:hypothetical protein
MTDRGRARSTINGTSAMIDIAFTKGLRFR